MDEEIKILDESHQRFDGINWFVDKRNGYYFPTKKHVNKSMHKYVWEKYNGKVPNGYDVHHKDHNKANNRIENLEILPIAEHRRQHQLDKIGYSGKFEGKCLSCGCEIDMSHGWSIFCSKRCKQAYARRTLNRYKVKRKCVVCGKEFESSKFRHSDTCSNKCKNEMIKKNVESSELGSKVICKYCGKEFHSIHRASCCCIQHKRKYDIKMMKSRKPNAICEECGNEFYRVKRGIRFCSKKCSARNRFRVGNK